MKMTSHQTVKPELENSKHPSYFEIAIAASVAWITEIIAL